MPEYLAPGVYVEEIDTGSKPIEGVSTSTAAVVGFTERGPVDVPILLTSYGDYTRWFGGKLPLADFPMHYHVPFAVEGFFSNGGKRLYLTRVIDTAGAARARGALHDRGQAGGVETMILRAAGELSGTLASPPLLYVLDVSAAAPGATLRIGDGSAAEYRTIVNVGLPASNTHVPLSFPLGLSHDGGVANNVEQIARTPLAGINALQLDQDASVGDTSIDVSGTAGDIQALLAGANMLIEIGAPAAGEHRFAGAVTQLTATTARIALQGGGLAMPHSAGGAVTVLDEAGAHGPLAGIGAFTLDVAANIGDTSIDVLGAAADITTLTAPLVPLPLLEVGASGEFRVASGILGLTATTARITLAGSGLSAAHAAGDAVTVLDTAGTTIQASRLTPAASAGDRLIFVDNRGGNLDTPGDLVLIDGANPARREARRIGQLGTVDLAAGAYEEYGGGSIVEHLALTDDTRTLSGAVAAAATTLNLTGDATQLLEPGSQLLVGLGPTQETVTVSSVDRSVPPHVVTVSSFANAHAAIDHVVPRFALNAASAAGSRVLSLENRVALAVGDVVRLGDAPNGEYATIESIPNRATAGADPGTVLLTHPLSRSHARGSLVRRQNSAAGANQPTTLALAAAAGATPLLVTHGTGYAAGDLVRITTFTGERFHHRLSAPFAASAPAEVELDRPLSAAHIAGSAVVERDPLLNVEAFDLGSWGNRIRLSVADEQPGVVSRTTLATVIDAQHIRLASAAGVESGIVLELLDPAAEDAPVGGPLKVESIDRSNFVLTLRAPGLSLAQQAAQVAAIAAGTRLGVRSREFRIEARLLNRPDPARPSRNDQVLDSEIFRFLSMDPRHSRYAPRVVGDPAAPLRRADRRPEGESWYIRISDVAPTEATRLGPETLTDLLPTGQRRPARHPIDRGDDSLATLTDAVYIGADNVDPELKTGLWTMTNVDDISILASPGRTSAQMQGALIAQCENLRYRVAVLDGPAPENDAIPDVQNLRQRYDSKYTALYYPWLLIDDPFPVNLQSIGTMAVPPSGHVMGIYARTDIERGVHKAPANEVVRGITGLRRIVNQAQQEILNPYPLNINVIRDFRPNRGIRVWGGRILTSDPDWKYVNVRRLIIFIERSIDLGLQWVVFEPNAEPLWARVRRTISNFLTTVWRNGALEGTTREEAYFVTCDRTTMTQADIDNGRLICVIGVAPVKPAEFVIIRIGLWTAHAEE